MIKGFSHLLLDDEQKRMIDRSLDRDDPLALYEGGLKSICVVADEANGCCELQNPATCERFQG